MIPDKPIRVASKKVVKKKELAPASKVKKEPKKVTKKEIKGIALTELSGLGPTTAKKFKEIGVENISDMCKEEPKELAMLIKGCSEERIKKWIEEAKELFKS